MKNIPLGHVHPSYWTQPLGSEVTYFLGNKFQTFSVNLYFSMSPMFYLDISCIPMLLLRCNTSCRLQFSFKQHAKLFLLSRLLVQVIQSIYVNVVIQIRTIFACMDSLLGSGKSICLLRRCPRRFQSQHWVLTLPEMGWENRSGCLWLLLTVILGYLLWLFILVLELDLIRLISMSFPCPFYKYIVVLCFFS